MGRAQTTTGEDGAKARRALATAQEKARELAQQLRRAEGVIARVAEMRGVSATAVRKLVERLEDAGIDVFAMAGVSRHGPGHPVEHGGYVGWRDPQTRDRSVVRARRKAARDRISGTRVPEKVAAKPSGKRGGLKKSAQRG